MCSPAVNAQDRVLAELAGLGLGSADAVTLLDQVRGLAGFMGSSQGEAKRGHATIMKG